jgi:hypothetical protein
MINTLITPQTEWSTNTKVVDVLDTIIALDVTDPDLDHSFWILISQDPLHPPVLALVLRIDPTEKGLIPNI